jgi:hypothetical protein
VCSTAAAIPAPPHEAYNTTTEPQSAYELSSRDEKYSTYVILYVFSMRNTVLHCLVNTEYIPRISLLKMFSFLLELTSFGRFLFCNFFLTSFKDFVVVKVAIIQKII